MNRWLSRAILQHSPNSPVRRGIRERFLDLDFDDQALLIGKYAKRRLNAADKIISDGLKSLTTGKIPRALDLWNNLMGSAADISNKKTNEQRDFIMFKELCPELVGVMDRIVEQFIDAYAHWVTNFYSCGKDGKSSLDTYRESKALTFDKNEMDKIDARSGMTGLGWNMKNFANILYSEKCRLEKFIPPYSQN